MNIENKTILIAARIVASTGHSSMRRWSARRRECMPERVARCSTPTAAWLLWRWTVVAQDLDQLSEFIKAARW